MPARYPALAEVGELEARLGHELDQVERAESVLDGASIRVRRASGRLWLLLGSGGALVTPHVVDPELPEIVWDITLTCAERAVRNPDGFSSESAGDYSYQRVGIPGGVGGLYLTDAEREELRQFWPDSDRRVAGLWTLSTTRNEWPDTTYWMPTSVGGDPFPVDELIE